MHSADVIRILGLEKLEPEGGFFRQVYKSRDEISAVFGDSGNSVKRSALTSIYYMVTPSSFSALHKLKATEVYHYYMGGRVELSLIDESGDLSTVVLGPRIAEGDQLQVVVEKNVWQGCRILPTDDSQWALVGTTVSPGFEFEDFTLAERADLAAKFPLHFDLIQTLTRAK
jgi:uncharacterized protein